MYTLLDLMRVAQGGAALNNMARQFGLSPEQAQRAMEALMPAFALAFQRNAADPMGLSNLMRMIGSGQYAQFFDQPMQAFGPFGASQGDDIVRQLFGPELARQVARQAAAWAGIAPDIMKEILPVTAAMLMGGLFRSATTEGLADFFERLADALRGNSAPARKDSEESSTGLPNPFNLWASMMAGVGGAEAEKTDKRTATQARSEQAPSPFGPWGDMMNAMLGVGQETSSQPKPAAPKEASPSNPIDFFGRMFETGIDAQQRYLASLQSIFDAYWSANHKRG